MAGLPEVHCWFEMFFLETKGESKGVSPHLVTAAMTSFELNKKLILNTMTGKVWLISIKCIRKHTRMTSSGQNGLPHINFL